MENFSFKNLSFTYPKADTPAISNISFNVKKGEFIIICGPSGCGKSTLLRHFKKCLTPFGKTTGEIFYNNTLIDEVDELTLAKDIGFVMQHPENQVVTDKVWHELSFGLENLGENTETIRRRVAETAAYFGITEWFHMDVNELSGGQKQILSLASVMVMDPKILVLDEPTSQLDPIAATDFLKVLAKINRELGVTVILSEHRLEEAFELASRVIVLNNGEILCDDIPKNVGLKLKNTGSEMFLAMPSAMRVWAGTNSEDDCPITVCDGVEFLTNLKSKQPLFPLVQAQDTIKTNEIALECKELWFRYQKDLPDVVKGLSLKLYKGEFYALLGGNGSGKTTTLKLLSSLKKAYSGSIKANGKVCMLPQNPQTIFAKDTVEKDLLETLDTAKISKEEKQKRLAEISALCEIQEILNKHPYDISGGEQQKAALAKMLLLEPEILLLDEPTKGFDAAFKVTFAKIIKKLNQQGVTVLMVSHDIEFCAEYATRCGMFFDGNIVAENTAREFFSGNSFYTTSANRMARHIIPKAVTVKDIITCFGGNIEENFDNKNDNKPKKGQKEDFKTKEESQKRKAKPRLSKRTILATIITLLLISITIFLGAFYFENKHYNIVALIVLFLCITPFILVFEGRKPKARELCIIAVLCAVAVASRGIFFMLPQIKPVLALTVIAGVALGGESGFLIGAVSMLLSNMLFSQGPFTPWQMFAMGIIGFLAGIIFKNVKIKKISIPLAIFGGISAIAIYGLIMNTYSAITMSTEVLNLNSLLVYYVAGLPMDIMHAVSTVIFILLGAKPMLKILDRIKLKYGLME